VGRFEIMVLDTCALLWRAFEKKKISKKAIHAILNASELLINSISIWEKWNHRDPADRVIVATAKILDIPIVSDDKEMKKFYRKVIW
jgi:PIN domain nuclease of toxin-antitoxin system